MRRWLAIAGILFALEFAWEMAQGGLFADLVAMPFWPAAFRCATASLGDLVITAFAFGAAALVARDARWPASRRPVAPFLVFLLVGLSITIALERHAIATGRWRYDARMPLIFGVGLLPILQWIALPALFFAILRGTWRLGSRAMSRERT
jgi:hypothetical protein